MSYLIYFSVSENDVQMDSLENKTIAVSLAEHNISSDADDGDEMSLEDDTLKKKPNIKDPLVRKMVMEVIFGSKKPEENIVENYSYNSSESGAQDKPDNHRPIRSRIAPVQKDFLYDLKNIAKLNSMANPHLEENKYLAKVTSSRQVSHKSNHVNQNTGMEQSLNIVSEGPSSPKIPTSVENIKVSFEK